MLIRQQIRRSVLGFAFALCGASLLASGCGSDDGGPTATVDEQPPVCDPLGTALPEGTAPIERGDMAFAVDPECQRAFMFFGDHAEPVMCGPAASEFMNDAYVYDANSHTWSELAIGGPAPTQRARGRAVWDETNKRVILFGGRFRPGTSGAYQWLNDVWAFDPETLSWAELSPLGAAGAPAGRMNMTFAADPDRNRVLVYGGGQLSADFTSYVIDDTTWAFDLANNSWSQIAQGGTVPTGRLFHLGAVDRTGGRLVIFGGGGADAFTTPTFMNDTWYLDFATNTWTEAQGAAPEGRIKGEMIYDGARNRMVLFAGHDDTSLGNNNDIWTLDLASMSWARVIEGDVFNLPAIAFCDFPADFALVDPASPERRESHLFDVAGDVAVMYGGRTDCGLSKDTWELDLPTLTWTQINESPLGMTCRRSGSLQCDDPNARMCI